MIPHRPVSGRIIGFALALGGMMPVPSPWERSRPDVGGPLPPPKGRHPGYECERCGNVFPQGGNDVKCRCGHVGKARRRRPWRPQCTARVRRNGEWGPVTNGISMLPLDAQAIAYEDGRWAARAEKGEVPCGWGETGGMEAADASIAAERAKR